MQVMEIFLIASDLMFWLQALETEREMLNVHTIDKKLAMQIAKFDRLYEDY